MPYHIFKFIERKDLYNLNSNYHSSQPPQQLVKKQSKIIKKNAHSFFLKRLLRFQQTVHQVCPPDSYLISSLKEPDRTLLEQDQNIKVHVERYYNYYE